MARVVFPCCAALSGQDPATSAVADGRSGKVYWPAAGGLVWTVVMVWERLWGGGRFGAATFGLPFGILGGGSVWAISGSATQAVAGGLVSGVIHGSFLAVTRWHAWPRGGQLSSPDRVAVMRAVQRGERVPDPRLAPEVLAYAQVIACAAERGQRQRWMLWVEGRGSGPASGGADEWILVRIVPAVGESDERGGRQTVVADHEDRTPGFRAGHLVGHSGAGLHGLRHSRQGWIMGVGGFSGMAGCCPWLFRDSDRAAPT